MAGQAAAASVLVCGYTAELGWLDVFRSPHRAALMRPYGSVRASDVRACVRLALILVALASYPLARRDSFEVNAFVFGSPAPVR